MGRIREALRVKKSIPERIAPISKKPLSREIRASEIAEASDNLVRLRRIAVDSLLGMSTNEDYEKAQRDYTTAAFTQASVREVESAEEAEELARAERVSRIDLIAEKEPEIAATLRDFYENQQPYKETAVVGRLWTSYTRIEGPSDELPVGLLQLAGAKTVQMATVIEMTTIERPLSHGENAHAA